VVSENTLMHIGEVAEQTGLSLRTLRHYEDLGLVTPSGRTEGGFRLYSPEDRDRLLVIRRMKPLGYSLEEMAEVLAAFDATTTGANPSALDGFLDDATKRRTRLHEHLQMAEEFIALLSSATLNTATRKKASPHTDPPQT